MVLDVDDTSAGAQYAPAFLGISSVTHLGLEVSRHCPGDQLSSPWTKYQTSRPHLGEEVLIKGATFFENF